MIKCIVCVHSDASHVTTRLCGKKRFRVGYYSLFRHSWFIRHIFRSTTRLREKASYILNEERTEFFRWFSIFKRIKCVCVWEDGDGKDGKAASSRTVFRIEKRIFRLKASKWKLSLFDLDWICILFHFQKVCAQCGGKDNALGRPTPSAMLTSCLNVQLGNKHLFFYMHPSWSFVGRA